MSYAFEAVLRSIDFIEENLQTPIGVGDAAGEAGYSLYHYIRLFEGYTGHSPKDYILRRRIAEAAAELRGAGKRVIDLGFDYQFGSPEAFSRSFRKITGLSPSEFRKTDYYDFKTLLSRIDADGVRHVERAAGASVDEITLDAFTMAGMVNLIREDKGVIGEMWEYMAKELHKIPAYPVLEYAGLSFWPDDYDIGGFFLMCGVKVSPGFTAEGPLCIRSVPGSRYLKFRHEGDVSTIASTYRYIFETFLPKSDYRLTKNWDLEVYMQAGGTDIFIPYE